MRATRPADVEDRLSNDAARALLGIGGLNVLKGCALGQAGRERGLIEVGQGGGELLHPRDERRAITAGHIPLTLEEQLVHLPELALQAGAGGGLGGADATLTMVEHRAEDEIHLSLAHVLIYDDRLYR